MAIKKPRLKTLWGEFEKNHPTMKDEKDFCLQKGKAALDEWKNTSVDDLKDKDYQAIKSKWEEEKKKGDSNSSVVKKLFKLIAYCDVKAFDKKK